MARLQFLHFLPCCTAKRVTTNNSYICSAWLFYIFEVMNNVFLLKKNGGQNFKIEPQLTFDLSYFKKALTNILNKTSNQIIYHDNENEVYIFVGQ